MPQQVIGPVLVPGGQSGVDPGQAEDRGIEGVLSGGAVRQPRCAKRHSRTPVGHYGMVRVEADTGTTVGPASVRSMRYSTIVALDGQHRGSSVA